MKTVAETVDDNKPVIGLVSTKKNRGNVPKKIHKAEREKLKRDNLNEIFYELGYVIDPARQNNGKATILCDTTRLLRDLITLIGSLKKENAALLNESHYVVAFATFTNHHSAMAAMGALDRTIFDPETGATLHIELARSNSRKRPRGGAPYMIIDKRTRVHEDDENNWSNDDGGSDEPSDTENDNSRNKAAFTATQSRKPDRKPANGRTAQDSEKAADTIRPCSTLFIANLGPTCTEAELEQVLSKFSGFRTLKMKGRSGMPVAFADFEDVESAAAALESLRGTTIGSSDRGEIHIEYARSKMRKA